MAGRAVRTKTAEASDSVTNASDDAPDSTVEQENPQSPQQPVPEQAGPKVQRDSRGIVKSNWDNDKNDPNERKSIADDPDGTANQLGKVPGE